MRQVCTFVYVSYPFDTIVVCNFTVVLQLIRVKVLTSQMTNKFTFHERRRAFVIA